jgi:YD repeat-containing protein
MRLSTIAAAAALLTPVAAPAAETVTYTYDAKGRVVRVARSGSVNNGVTATYQFDRADNRTRLTTTGSPNPPQP